MNKRRLREQSGFSLMELMISMLVMVSLMGIITTIVAKSVSIRARETQKTDALTSAQAALNVMSREISNSGFGIYDDAFTENPNNGIIIADSNNTQIHVRANISNYGYGPINPACSAICTDDPGEDITYSFEPTTRSIIRYDPHGFWNGTAYVPQTSVVVNRISNVFFRYYDYAADGTVTGPLTAPSTATGRVELVVEATMDPVQGQPNPLAVRFTSEINLRNSSYMLHQY